MFLATVNCFQVPYNVAFGADTSALGFALNAIIDLFFILDILINFRTSFVNEITGMEIFDLRMVMIKYLRSKFAIDLLASIPFDYFGLVFAFRDDESFWLEFFSILKLVRVLRLSRLITHLNLKNEVKVSLRLAKLIFFLVLYLHCVG